MNGKRTLRRVARVGSVALLLSAWTLLEVAENRRIGERTLASLLLLRGQKRVRYDSGGSGGQYEYLRPVYTLPTGMSYNPATGIVDGTVLTTTYSAPATEVSLSDAGSRAANAAALASAISTAAASGSGTRIRLAAGADFGGSYTLPVNSSSGWIYIEAAGVKSGAFTAGTRATSADASNMPKLYATGINVPVFTLPAGNNKYRFVGLEFAMAPSGVSWDGESGPTGNVNPFILHNTESATESDYCSHVVVDRCYLHGNAAAPKACKRLMLINGKNIAVIDSSLEDVLGDGLGDGQCFLSTSGPGPYKLVNNYMTQACDGEHVVFGGGNARITPADIEVQRNHFYVPLAWYSVSGRDLKNQFELKVGHRVLLQGNLFENFQSSNVLNQYFALNLKTVDQNGLVPAAGTADVVVRLNEWRNCSGWLQLAANPENNGTPMTRVELTGNRVPKQTSDYSDRIRVYAMQIQDSIDGVRVRHNSVARYNNDGEFVIACAFGSTNGMVDHEYTDNLFVYTDSNPNLWWRNTEDLSNAGLTGWNAVSNSGALGTYSGNALAQTSSVPSGNTTVASEAAADFVSATLALNDTSPLKRTATAGRDPGAVHALIDAVLAEVS